MCRLFKINCHPDSRRPVRLVDMQKTPAFTWRTRVHVAKWYAFACEFEDIPPVLTTMRRRQVDLRHRSQLNNTPEMADGPRRWEVQRASSSERRSHKIAFFGIFPQNASKFSLNTPTPINLIFSSHIDDVFC